MDDPQRAAALGTAGRRYVERHHTWDAAAERLEHVYDAARKAAYRSNAADAHSACSSAYAK
jgi:glycosyltransferase involved in cell wall biosynthesis